MNVNKPIIAGALALTLIVGAGSAAYAWNGGFGHNQSSSHRVAEHGRGNASLAAQNNASAYQHGGAHEQAADNVAVHEREMQDPKHRD